MTSRRRLLFVHAHPDDETLATGVALAHYAQAGHEVTVLTCTLGDEGEVIPPELAHHAADRDDTLGRYRRGELAAAAGALGVQHRVLGEDPVAGVAARYRDSGMAGTATTTRAGALAAADPDEVAGLIAGELLRVRPDLVVTYDRGGGYGHPDHIMVHRATMAALCRLPADDRPVAAIVVVPRSWALADRRWLLEQAEHGSLSEAELPSGRAVSLPALNAPWPVGVVGDELVDAVVVDPSVTVTVVAAMRAHATQVAVFDGFHTLSDAVAVRWPFREAFAIVDPADPVPRGRSGLDASPDLLEAALAVRAVPSAPERASEEGEDR